MIKLKSSLALLSMLLLCLVLAACSSKSGRSAVEPGMQGDSISDVAGMEAEGNRGIIAVYDAEINLNANTFTITPSERESSYHFAISQTYPNVLKITGVQYTPTFWVDIKLVHPFPGTSMGAFDPRVIAIVPANNGVRFNYPALGAVGNNKVVLEPDGYTNLFDSVGGTIPGTVNPFKAYFKNEPYRKWPNTGTTSETQRWNMDLAGFGGLMNFKLVVDVSTNYPRLPVPGLDNAAEPVVPRRRSAYFCRTYYGALPRYILPPRPSRKTLRKAR